MPVDSANRSLTQTIINAAAGTPQELVALAVGMRIYVVRYVLTANTATGTIQFTEGTGPTALTGLMSLVVGGGFVAVGDQGEAVLFTNTPGARLSISPVTCGVTGYLHWFYDV